MKNRLNLSGFAFALCLIFSLMKVQGQVISEPVFSLNGNPAALLCVSNDDPDTAIKENERQAMAQYSGPGSFFGPGTVFILELSDENGVFSETTTIELVRFTSPTALGGTAEITFPSFEIPTNLRGENYSLRIRVPRDGAEDFLSAINNDIPIYFFDITQPILIVGPNTEVTNVAICDNQAVTLRATPSDFPIYQWFYEGIEIEGETEATLSNVIDSGTYTVRAELGSCDPFFEFDSSSIEVFQFEPDEVIIEGSFPASFCPSDPKSLRTNAVGFDYEWFKDGELIPNSNVNPLPLPQSNFGGSYTVNVIGSSSCSVLTNPVEIINLGFDILTQPPPQLTILPGQPTITLAITTNAPAGSTVQWFRLNNGMETPLSFASPVSDPSALSIDVSNTGEYLVRVTPPATAVCPDPVEVQTELFTPVGFRTQIASVIDCDDNSGAVGVENIFGITSTAGVEVPLTEDQYSFFDFEWFQNNTSNGNTTITQTISESDIGTTFALEATFRNGGFPVARSNDFLVEFLNEEVTINASSPFVPEGESVTLTAPENARYTYEWFRVVDGENQIITGEITNTLVINENGLYFVRITLEECTIDSVTLNVSPSATPSEIIPNIITPNGDNINDTWALPASLVNQQDVEVTIYRQTGQVDFSGNSYQNDWPRENSKSSGEDQIYYYIIARNNTVVKKGSITVMR